MKKFRKLQDGLSFFFLGRFIIETKLNDFEKKGNRITHILSCSWAFILHEFYEPKVIVTGMSGRNTGNELMTVVTYLFLTVTLLLVCDIRDKKRKSKGGGWFKYYIRSIALISFYSIILYWTFVLLNIFNYQVVHLSPFDAIRIPASG